MAFWNRKKDDQSTDPAPAEASAPPAEESASAVEPAPDAEPVFAPEPAADVTEVEEIEPAAEVTEVEEIEPAAVVEPAEVPAPASTDQYLTGDEAETSVLDAIANAPLDETPDAVVASEAVDPDATVVSEAVDPDATVVSEPAADAETAVFSPVVARTSAFKKDVPAEVSAEPVAEASDEVSETALLDGIGEEPPAKTKKRWPKVLGWTAAAVVVLGGAYVGAQAMLADRVPRETTVLGTDIGGMSSDDAVAAINELNTEWTSKTIDVQAADMTGSIDPAAAGLSIDAQATVDKLTGFSLDPRRLWQHIAGTPEDITPEIAVDDQKMNTTVRTIADQLKTVATDATVAFNPDGTVTSTDAIVGHDIDPQSAREKVVAQWLTVDRPIVFDTTDTEPTLTQAKLDAFLSSSATPLTSGNVTVAVGDHQVPLTPAQLVAAATITSDTGDFTMDLNADTLGADVMAGDPSLGVAPQDGYYTFVDGVPSLVPSVDGVGIDNAQLKDAVLAAIATPERVATTNAVPVRPEKWTTEYLQSMGISEMIVQFSTPLTSEPKRTQNIRVAGEKITGVLVEPGGTFNTLDTIGPITFGNGYIEAGVVSEGVHVDGLGGGLSQIGTTMFNAGFEAGYLDVEHHPHSYWFTRYPPGREATLAVGSKNVIWTNDTPYGALLKVYVSGGRVWVEVWSTKYWNVNISSGPKTNVRSITTEVVTHPDCEPYPGGNSGFTITVSRTKTAPDGTPGPDWSDTTTYKPDNAYTCG